MITERWGVAELDVTSTPGATVIFEHDGERRYVESFPSRGRELVRFSPEFEGLWRYRILDAAGRMAGHGELECGPPGPDNHGPVVIVDELRFGYADRTPYTPIGTCARWWHRAESAQRAATLAQLADAPFTKIRMDVLADGSATAPAEAELDQLEAAVRELAGLGIQAELVIFTPELLADPAVDWRGYLRPLVARFAAFRNVAWCLAIDPDRWPADHPASTDQFWDEVLRLLAECDHGQRLRTIQAGVGFDFGARLITHCSLHHDQPRVCSVLTRRYRKPVLVDDLGMEGDAANHDGSRSAEDLVADIWEAVCRGGFAGHGEWYDNRWWAVGGELKGAAPPRLALLGSILDEAPIGLRYGSVSYDASTLEVPGQYYLQYLGAHRFRHRRFELPADALFRVEVIDTWNLRRELVADRVSGEYLLELPVRQYNAIRITRC
ncbi:hypothetical protein FOE78_15160 [Microlunatus elymi]|uniref:DUF5605 domain-containing protein n=1 Tax=Microlunatus elymi TaxID=2596828 RepID=A0A516Q0X8_9ACTN|nr:DUF5605 domain-containing protein [Microlunatus elymi]QDP97086.1 hypothetical protein FOE78_15160 [Microlunatus elymi]